MISGELEEKIDNKERDRKNDRRKRGALVSMPELIRRSSIFIRILSAVISNAEPTHGIRKRTRKTWAEAACGV